MRGVDVGVDREIERLQRRLNEIEGGSFHQEIGALKAESIDELKKQYAARQIEE